MFDDGQHQGVDLSHAQSLAPQQRISTPDFVDWHMIFDYELDQLSQFETGVLGSVGFVALGAVLGTAAQFSEVMHKISSNPPAPLGGPDIVYVCVFVGSMVAAFICLGLFGLNRFRNSGLTKKIRRRKRHNLATPSSNAETPSPSA